MVKTILGANGLRSVFFCTPRSNRYKIMGGKVGRKKTYREQMEEIRLREIWLNRQPPLKSPCLKGRRRHCFGRGAGKIHKRCFWCGKSREQIRAEQRGTVKQK